MFDIGPIKEGLARWEIAKLPAVGAFEEANRINRLIRRRQEFLGHAPQDIAALVEEVERLEDEMESARIQLTFFGVPAGGTLTSRIQKLKDSGSFREGVE